MSGEEDLATLLKSMSPSLEDEVYVFGHIPADSENATNRPYTTDLIDRNLAQMVFWEKEGWTLIVPEKDAPAGLNPVFRCKKITLNVHSSLDAVGFMAKITTRLTELKIGVNPVSAYFHDHLFVPVGKEDAVIEALKKMTEEAKG